MYKFLLILYINDVISTEVVSYADRDDAEQAIAILTAKTKKHGPGSSWALGAQFDINVTRLYT